MSCDISNKLNYFSVLLLPGRGITLNTILIAHAFLFVLDNAFAIMSKENVVLFLL